MRVHINIRSRNSPEDDLKRVRLGELGLATGICLLAFSVRVPALVTSNLGFDGGLAVALARMPIVDLLDLSTRDVHPPLFSLVLKIWLRLASPSLATAMWPSLAFGVLAVAAAWWIGRALISVRAGAVMALLLALNPLAVHDGMAVRDFVVLVPAVLLTTGLLMPDLPGVSRFAGGRAILFALLYVVMALSSVYFVVVAVAHAAALVLLRRSLRPWLIAAAPGCVAFAIWAAILAVRIGPILVAGSRPTEGVAPDLWTLISALVAAITGGSVPGSPINGAQTWVLLAVWAGTIAVFRTMRGREGSGTSTWVFTTSRALGISALVGLCVSVLSIATAVTFWLNEPVPGRYALIPLPFAVVLVGYAVEIAARANRASAAVLAFLAITPLVVGLLPANQTAPLPARFWDPVGMVERLDRDTFNDDRILFISLEQAGYYAVMTQRPRPWVVVPVGPAYLEGNLVENSIRRVAQLTRDPGRVWLVLYQGGIAPRHQLVRDALYARTFPSGDADLADSKMLLYAVPGPPTIMRSSATIADYSVARLESIGQSGATEPGSTIGVTLTWKAKGPMDRSYRAFAHLLNDRGEKIAQWDTVPADETRPTDLWRPDETIVDRHGLFVPWDASGKLAVAVGLYADDGRLKRVDGGDTTVAQLNDR